MSAPDWRFISNDMRTNDGNTSRLVVAPVAVQGRLWITTLLMQPANTETLLRDHAQFSFCLSSHICFQTCLSELPLTVFQLLA